MDSFEHESLDPYPTAIEWVALVDRVTMLVPPTRGYLVEELREAATTVAGSIAIGASEPDNASQLRFLIEARRAALRCAALLDVMQALVLVAPDQRDLGRQMLLRIVERLGKMEHTLGAELGGPAVQESAS